MASLRSLYEERQKGHQHTQPGESKQVGSLYMELVLSLQCLVLSRLKDSSWTSTLQRL